MKRLATICTLILLTTLSPISAQSEAGAIFLLISPGARAGGMGEAQVAGMFHLVLAVEAHPILVITLEQIRL